MELIDINPTPKGEESKKILIFNTTTGLTRYIAVNYGTTVAEALRQFLKEIGKSNLEKSDKISFLSRGLKIDFSNKNKVENFFADNSPITVCDTHGLIGIIKENIRVNFISGLYTTTIFCEIDEKMKSIFDKFISEAKIENNYSILFLYAGGEIKEDLQLNQIIKPYDLKSKEITITVTIYEKDENKLHEKNESNIGFNNIEDNDPSKITIFFLL
jgi:hypothetical protein